MFHFSSSYELSLREGYYIWKVFRTKDGKWYYTSPTCTDSLVSYLSCEEAENAAERDIRVYLDKVRSGELHLGFQDQPVDGTSILIDKTDLEDASGLEYTISREFGAWRWYDGLRASDDFPEYYIALADFFIHHDYLSKYRP